MINTVQPNFGRISVNELKDRQNQNGEDGVRVRDKQTGNEFLIRAWFEMHSYPPQYEFSALDGDAFMQKLARNPLVQEPAIDGAPDKRYYSEPEMDFEAYRNLPNDQKEQADFFINDLDFVG